MLKRVAAGESAYEVEIWILILSAVRVNTGGFRPCICLVETSVVSFVFAITCLSLRAVTTWLHL